eukprot:m.151664 g.151664  ORF g.151664 m.151664 type:complete len:115 (+) comp14253_c1_seq2:239-583(+)
MDTLDPDIEQRLLHGPVDSQLQRHLALLIYRDLMLTKKWTQLSLHVLEQGVVYFTGRSPTKDDVQLVLPISIEERLHFARYFKVTSFPLSFSFSTLGGFSTIWWFYVFLFGGFR